MYKFEDNKLLAIKVSTTIPSDYKFASVTRTYYIHFNEIIVVEEVNDLVARDFVTSDIFTNILFLLKKYLEREKSKKNIQRGSLVKYEDKFLYIYSIESDTYLGYRLHKLSNNEKFPIVIESEQYSADFDDTYRLNKDDIFEVITLASEKEADNNKITKKSYSKSKGKIKKPKELVMSNIKVGTLVSDKRLNPCLYIVLERKNNDLLALMLGDNNNYLGYINVNDIVFKKELTKEEFRNVLIHLKEQRDKYYGDINEQKLESLIKAYSK